MGTAAVRIRLPSGQIQSKIVRLRRDNIGRCGGRVQFVLLGMFFVKDVPLGEMGFISVSGEGGGNRAGKWK